MSSHVPTFHNVTEWTASRTAPTWAECPCGWESEVMPDQTAAEHVHGLHMVAVGAISAELARDAELDRWETPAPDCGCGLCLRCVWKGLAQ